MKNPSEQKAEKLLHALNSSLKNEPPVEPTASFAAGVMRSIKTEVVRVKERHFEQEFWGCIWRYSVGALSCAVLAIVFAVKADISIANDEVDLLVDQIAGVSDSGLEW